jgi:hypothetical protein
MDVKEVKELLSAPEPEVVGFIPPPMMAVTPAHDQTQSHKYIVHFPDHLPRKEDPLYSAFRTYHKATAKTAQCYIGQRIGFASCAGGLELHHAHVEFSLANGISLDAIQKDFPDLLDMKAVLKWVESERNFRWLCVFHHRGHAGTHVASHADWEAGQYVPALIS